MKKINLFIPLAGTALLLAASLPVLAEPEFPKVSAISGDVEIFRSGEGWKKLETLSSLKKGCKIRTGEKSFVEIAWNPRLESVAKLDENGQLSILSQDALRLFLMQGRIYVLRESSAASRLPMKIATPDTFLKIGPGGSTIEVSNKETQLKVFSEKVQMFSFKDRRPEGKTVPEGYKFFSGAVSPYALSHLARMDYADYKEWQTWVQRSYERKDDLATEAFQKEAA